MADPATFLASNSVLGILFTSGSSLIIHLWKISVLLPHYYCKYYNSEFRFLHSAPLKHNISKGPAAQQRNIQIPYIPSNFGPADMTFTRNSSVTSVYFLSTQSIKIPSAQNPESKLAVDRWEQPGKNPARNVELRFWERCWISRHAHCGHVSSCRVAARPPWGFTFKETNKTFSHFHTTPWLF